MMAASWKLVIAVWKDVVVPCFPWAIVTVCCSTNPYVLEYLSAVTVWSFFCCKSGGMLIQRIVHHLRHGAPKEQPDDVLPPPPAWAETVTEALDGKLETLRLLRADSSPETAKRFKAEVALKLARGAAQEQLFKELDEQILHGLRRLSEGASRHLEYLKNKFGIHAAKPSKTIVVEKLSDADCRTALPKALQAAALLMQCHRADKEIRRLVTPRHVKAMHCAWQLERESVELHARVVKSVADLIAVAYKEGESRPNDSRIQRSPVDCMQLVVKEFKRKAADVNSCNNCAVVQTTNDALARTTDALRTANEKLLADYNDMLQDRVRDKAEMERLVKLVKLRAEKGTAKETK